MGLTKTSDSNIIYLQVKHYSLWQEIKKPVDGCESIEVTNPKTKEVITKYGYKFRSLTGRAVKLIKYDTEQKYPTRYFGFKLHMQDGDDLFVLDMPYQSQILRRFLRVARNVDWSLPLSITIFKGKGNGGKNDETTGVWFQQQGETVKPYYSRETPHGMPDAIQDPDTHEWDFKAQHRWLVERLKEETVSDIERAAAVTAPPMEPDHGDAEEPPQVDNEIPPHAMIDDDDVPFRWPRPLRRGARKSDETVFQMRNYKAA